MPPLPEDAIEFPRDRKPWKRDRDAVRYTMQVAINRRRAMRPLGRYDSGEGYGHRDHVERIVHLLWAAQARRRIEWDKREGRKLRSVILRDLAGVHSLIEGARFRDRVPLPTPARQDSEQPAKGEG